MNFCSLLPISFHARTTSTQIEMIRSDSFTQLNTHRFSRIYIISKMKQQQYNKKTQQRIHTTCNENNNTIMTDTVSASYNNNNNPYGLKNNEVSSGTTICAIPFKDGVVLGADSRVSTGIYVANRVSDKIVQLSNHIYACRSGSAADTQAITDMVRYYLSSLSIEMGNIVRVKTAAHIMAKIIYNNKDNLSAGLIVAGWDPVDGNSVYSIPLGGTCIKVPFAMGGSGSTYIYGLMDSEYSTLQTPSELSAEDARILVKKVVAHAMARDGSSGGVIRTVTVSAPNPTDIDGTTNNYRDYTNGNELPFGPTGF